MQLVFDLSTLARSSGQAVGIVRVVRELARWARAHRPGTVFAIFDQRDGVFRRVNDAHLDALIEGSALVDTSTQQPGEGGFFRGARLWLRNPRRRFFQLLEVRRLRGSRRAARLQDWLMTAKQRAAMMDLVGRRRMMLPFDVAAAAPIRFDSGQLLLGPGSDWGPQARRAVVEARERSGLRVATVCYDTVPLAHPEFYPAGIGDGFRAMFDEMVHLTDLLLVTATRVAEDIRDHCVANGLPLPPIRAFQLGANLPAFASATGGTLPPPLEAGRYALFVGTIEPRKGHQLLFETWKRLLAEGVPQHEHFRLLFLGQRGWRTEQLVAEIEAHPSFGDSLLILSGIDDRTLATLYRNAAFTLLPSLYEGYGLPVVESFQFGKPVLASTGGALPEVVGEFSPCLDPTDAEAWFAAMRDWIVDPAQRAPYEAAIRTRFRHPDWVEAAAAFHAILDEVFASAPSR